MAGIQAVNRHAYLSIPYGRFSPDVDGERAALIVKGSAGDPSTPISRSLFGFRNLRR